MIGLIVIWDTVCRLSITPNPACTSEHVAYPVPLSQSSGSDSRSCPGGHAAFDYTARAAATPQANIKAAGAAEVNMAIEAEEAEAEAERSTSW